MQDFGDVVTSLADTMPNDASVLAIGDDFRTLIDTLVDSPRLRLTLPAEGLHLVAALQTSFDLVIAADCDADALRLAWKLVVPGGALISIRGRCDVPVALSDGVRYIVRGDRDSVAVFRRRRKTVWIAVPNEGWIHRTLANEVGKWLLDRRHRIVLRYPSKKPIDNNRNAIVREFLEAPRGDFLLMVDADNTPSANPLDDVDLDLDVIGFPTPVWYLPPDKACIADWPIFWNGMIDDPGGSGGWRENQHRHGIQEVDAVGTGCILIARRVLETVKPAFVREWDPEWGTQVIGSDFLFCRRVREAGFRVFCDYDRPCNHFKERNLAEIWQLMASRDFAGVPIQPWGPAEWQRTRESGAGRSPECVTEAVADIVRRRAVEIGATTVLDVGCGDCRLIRRLVDSPESTTFRRLIGMDLCSPNGMAVNDPRVELLTGDIWRHADIRADIVVAMDFLPFIPDERQCVERLSAQTRDTLIITVPADCQPDGLVHGRYRGYTRGRLAALFGKDVAISEIGDHYVVVLKIRQR